MIKEKAYRVRASVYPTPHNKIWLSSGRFPLYDYYMSMNFINLSVMSWEMTLDKKIKQNLKGIGWEI